LLAAAAAAAAAGARVMITARSAEELAAVGRRPTPWNSRFSVNSPLCPLDPHWQMADM